ncbi:hypothetical protein N2152v2_003952 [Parachlorella kessleri]
MEPVANGHHGKASRRLLTTPRRGTGVRAAGSLHELPETFSQGGVAERQRQLLGDAKHFSLIPSFLEGPEPAGAAPEDPNQAPEQHVPEPTAIACGTNIGQDTVSTQLAATDILQLAAAVTEVAALRQTSDHDGPSAAVTGEDGAALGSGGQAELATSPAAVAAPEPVVLEAEQERRELVPTVNGVVGDTIVAEQLSLGITPVGVGGCDMSSLEEQAPAAVLALEARLSTDLPLQRATSAGEADGREASAVGVAIDFLLEGGAAATALSTGEDADLADADPQQGPLAQHSPQQYMQQGPGALHAAVGGGTEPQELILGEQLQQAQQELPQQQHRAQHAQHAQLAENAEPQPQAVAEEQQQQQQPGEQQVWSQEHDQDKPDPAARFAACCRGNLGLVAVSRNELGRLVELDQLIRAHCAAKGAPSTPSVLSGLVVRFSASKAYRLSRLAGVQQGYDGKQHLLLRDGAYALITLPGASNTVSVGDDLMWAQHGQHEAQALWECMAAAHQEWTLEEVASAGWRKKLAFAWLAFVAGTEADPQAEVPLLLARLADPEGIGRILARVQVAPLEQHAGQQGLQVVAVLDQQRQQEEGSGAALIQQEQQLQQEQQQHAEQQQRDAATAMDVDFPPAQVHGALVPGQGAPPPLIMTAQGGGPGIASHQQHAQLLPKLQHKQARHEEEVAPAQVTPVALTTAVDTPPTSTSLYGNAAGAAGFQPPSALSASMLALPAPAPSGVHQQHTLAPSGRRALPQVPSVAAADAPAAKPSQRQVAAAKTATPSQRQQQQQQNQQQAPPQASAAGAFETLQQMLALARHGTTHSAAAEPQTSANMLLPPHLQPAHKARAGTGGAGVTAGAAAGPGRGHEGVSVEEMAARIAGAAAKLESTVGASQQQQVSDGRAASEPPRRGAQPARQAAGHDAADAARRAGRRRQPIQWQPQESSPEDRPLGAPRAGSQGPAVATGAAAGAAATGREPAPGGIQLQLPQLTITRTFDAPSPPQQQQYQHQQEQYLAPAVVTKATVIKSEEGELTAPLGPVVVQVDATGLSPPSPSVVAGPLGPSPQPSADGLLAANRAAFADGGGLTLVVRTEGPALGQHPEQHAAAAGGPSRAQSVGLSSRGVGAGGGGAGAASSLVEQVQQQEAAVLAQLQQLSAAELAAGTASGKGAGAGTGVGAAGLAGAAGLGAIPTELLNMPAHILLSLYGAQMLQQQLGSGEGHKTLAELLAAAAACGGALGAAPSAQHPERAQQGEDSTRRRERGSGGREAEGGVGGKARPPGEDGRQVQQEPSIASPGSATAAEVVVALPGCDDLAAARRHLERLTRHVVHSKRPRAPCQRACLRELLLKGLSQGAGRGLFRQAGVNIAQLGEMMLQAARASPDVGEDYEKYGGAGRVTQLASDLEALGVVERLRTKRGGWEVLLRVDRLERLAAEQGGSRSERKRARAAAGEGAEQPPSRASSPPPPSKQPRHEDPRYASRPPRGGSEAPSAGGGGGRPSSHPPIPHPQHQQLPPGAPGQGPAPVPYQRIQGVPRGFPAVSRGPTPDRGSMEYADHWDPVWRYEHAVVRFLRKQGQVPLEELERHFPLPAIYRQPPARGDFRGWVLHRPHLFDVAEGGLVGAVKGASALLQYKRDMLQYLVQPGHPGQRALLEQGLQVDVPLPADTPPSIVEEVRGEGTAGGTAAVLPDEWGGVMPAQGLQVDVPLPADTLPSIVEEAQMNFWAFLRKYYGREVWLVAPKHYAGSHSLKTVELRPFRDPRPHPAAPRLKGVCRYFEPNRPGSCNKQQSCDFAHCTERVL